MCCFYQAQTLPLKMDKLNPEPENVPAGHSEGAAGEAEYACAVCNDQKRLQCVHCRQGRVAFLGGEMTCDRCLGAGWKPCPFCCVDR